MLSDPFKIFLGRYHQQFLLNYVAGDKPMNFCKSRMNIMNLLNPIILTAADCVEDNTKKLQDFIQFLCISSTLVLSEMLCS